MRQAVILLLLVFTILKSSAQNTFLATKEYLIRNQRALKYHDQKQYLKSGLSFDSLSKANKGNGVTRNKYIAASSWSQAGNPNKAFYYLTQYVKEIQTFDVDFLYQDPNFESLHQDLRWEPLTNQSKAKIKKAEQKYHPLDTLVDVDTHKLFFSIIKGSSTVILFEAGGMDNSTTWEGLLIPIADATGATLITYDRAGFGRSTRDSINSDITNEIKGLEKGLSRLGYGNSSKILVCHSLGGVYSTINATRNPQTIKAAIFIDACISNFFTPQTVKRLYINPEESLEDIKKKNIGMYYIAKDLEKNYATLRATTFPSQIPITSIYADNPPFGEADSKEWKICQQNFIKSRPNSKVILAEGCNHYIFIENPQLVINEIIKSYKEATKTANQIAIQK
jgi:pimeloyl-ACP methyl ester carboxylesterase